MTCHNHVVADWSPLRRVIVTLHVGKKRTGRTVPALDEACSYGSRVQNKNC